MHKVVIERPRWNPGVVVLLSFWRRRLLFAADQRRRYGRVTRLELLSLTDLIRMFSQERLPRAAER